MPFAFAVCLDNKNTVRRMLKEHNAKYVFGDLLNEEQEKEWKASGGAFDPATSMGLEPSTYNFATGKWVPIEGN